MPKKMLKTGALSTFFIFIFCSSLRAWPYYYDGQTVVDINQIYNPPPHYDFCEKRYGEGDDAQALNACSRGHLQARIMADRFGEGNGRALGLMMGYSRGMRNSFFETRENGTLIEQGREAVRASGDFSNAEKEGMKLAQGVAYGQAKSDAIQRFRQAVLKQVE